MKRLIDFLPDVLSKTEWAVIVGSSAVLGIVNISMFGLLKSGELEI